MTGGMTGLVRFVLSAPSRRPRHMQQTLRQDMTILTRWVFPSHRAQDAVQRLRGALRALAAEGGQEGGGQRHLEARLGCRGWGAVRPQGRAQVISADTGEAGGVPLPWCPACLHAHIAGIGSARVVL